MVKSVLLVLVALPPWVSPPAVPDEAPVALEVAVLDPALPLLVLLPSPPAAPAEIPPVPLALPPSALASVLPPTLVSVPSVAAPLLAPSLLCTTLVLQLPVQVLVPVLVWSPAAPEPLSVAPVLTPIWAPEPPVAEALPPVPAALPPEPPAPPLPPLEEEEPADWVWSPLVVEVLPDWLLVSVTALVLLPQSPMPRKQMAAAWWARMAEARARVIFIFVVGGGGE